MRTASAITSSVNMEYEKALTDRPVNRHPQTWPCQWDPGSRSCLVTVYRRGIRVLSSTATAAAVEEQEQAQQEPD